MNLDPGSEAAKVNETDEGAGCVPGPVAITVSGATVSTVNSVVAGVGSTLPAASLARTENEYPPSARPSWRCGDTHAAHGCCAPPGPSSSHWNREPASVAVKASVTLDEAIAPCGAEVIAVFGGVVSTANASVAGEGSALPAASTARTE